MIWLATGCKLDIKQDPLLSEVMKEFPIQVIFFFKDTCLHKCTLESYQMFFKWFHLCEGYWRLAMHIRKLTVGRGVSVVSDGAVHRSSGWSAFAVQKQISTSIVPQNPLNLSFPPHRLVLMQWTWLVGKLLAWESQRISQVVGDGMSSRFLSWVERKQKLTNMFNRWRVCCGFRSCEWITFWGETH